LGLPIVNGRVGLHGGRMQIRSEVDAGTEIVIEFPLERIYEEAPAEPAVAA
ncbi:MAG: ATP-binding protein, partial [Shimia sp.]|nr:ATP-binding protein [Shimia sp.]